MSSTYRFDGETQVFYPRLADFPSEGEFTNLVANPGDEVVFADRQPPPGNWALVPPKNPKRETK